MKKTAILFLPNFQYFPEAHLPYDLSPNIRVHKGPIKGLEDENISHWQSTIGSHIWKEDLAKRKVYVECMLESQDEEGLGNRILNNVYSALMISAPLRVSNGVAYCFNIDGEIKNGELIVNASSGLSIYNLWYDSGYMRSEEYHDNLGEFLESKDLLTKWKNVFNSLHELRKKKGKLILELAIESFRRGLESTYLDFRVPDLVRSIETVMPGKRNLTKPTFTSSLDKILSSHKILFIKNKSNLKKSLDDLFEIRSSCIHGMPFGWKIRKKLKGKKKMWMYEYLAEFSSRVAIEYALNSKELQRASKYRGLLEKWVSKTFSISSPLKLSSQNIKSR